VCGTRFESIDDEKGTKGMKAGWPMSIARRVLWRPVFFATIAVTLTAAALPTSATSSFAGNWSEGLPQK